MGKDSEKMAWRRFSLLLLALLQYSSQNLDNLAKVTNQILNCNHPTQVNSNQTILGDTLPTRL